jgi:hypothetical protein
MQKAYTRMVQDMLKSLEQPTVIVAAKIESQHCSSFITSLISIGTDYFYGNAEK